MDLDGITGVLLDMDGTLVDSDAAVERAWVAWSGEYDVPVASVLAISPGAPAEATIRRVRPDLPDAGVTAAVVREHELQYDDLSDVVATPGAADLLATLDRLGLPWAVVTSADARLAGNRLTAAGLPVPAVLVTVEDVAAGKPDPEGYRLGAARLGVDPATCLVVEDSDAGLAAGRAAGATTAALRGLAGDLRIRDLGELAARFEQAYSSSISRSRS